MPPLSDARPHPTPEARGEKRILTDSHLRQLGDHMLHGAGTVVAKCPEVSEAARAVISGDIDQDEPHMWEKRPMRATTGRLMGTLTTRVRMRAILKYTSPAGRKPASCSGRVSASLLESALHSSPRGKSSRADTPSSILGAAVPNRAAVDGAIHNTGEAKKMRNRPTALF